jgi:carbon monoxide dehydrogenase subunit G
MASIRKEIAINANPDDVWDALRDWSALHTRLVPGFVVDARLDGEDRIVTFFTGTEVCERFVSSDDEQRRLVWAINDGSLGLTHYNASAQVFAGDADGTRFVWIVDLLPHELAPTVEQLMERGINTIKETLEATPVDA